jgi:hypothetical protein
MSKINKKLLKSIVKECLVEILAEGLVQGKGSPVEKKRHLKESIEKKNKVLREHRIDPGLGRVTENERSNLQQRGSYLDQVSYSSDTRQTSKPQENRQDQRTSRLISNVTKDPLMSEIFADTAASTLKAQAGAEGRRGSTAPSMPADQAARIVEASDPMELFGDSAGKWAEMAFAPKINR